MYDPLYQEAAVVLRALLERVHHRARVLEGEMGGLERLGDEDRAVANAKDALGRATKLQNSLLEALETCEGGAVPLPSMTDQPQLIEFKVRGADRRVKMSPTFKPERRKGERRQPEN